MTAFKLLVLATVLAAAPACKKKEDKPATPVADNSGAMGSGSGAGSGMASDPGSAAGSGSAGSGSAMGSATGSDNGSAGSAAGSAAPVVDDNADHVVVLARHKQPKPIDPVSVRFETFKVVKASFDPKKIEGG